VISRRQQHRAGNPAAVEREYPAGLDRPDACCIVTRSSSMLGRTTLALLAVFSIGLAAYARADTLPGSSRAHEALALCDAATRETDRQVSLTLLDRGLATAESAIGEDDADAAAHFAVFCNLGRQLQLRSIGLLTFFDVRRLRREIDRTLELAPHSPGVLTAKGVMLLRLPRLLGGDTSEGERLIRRALEVAPGFAPAQEALRGEGP
jgi:hypothetical protein